MKEQQTISQQNKQTNKLQIISIYTPYLSTITRCLPTFYKMNSYMFLK